MHDARKNTKNTSYGFVNTVTLTIFGDGSKKVNIYVNNRDQVSFWEEIVKNANPDSYHFQVFVPSPPVAE